MSKSESSMPKIDSNEENIDTNSDESEPGFGWTPYAEIVNGRVAMLAVLSLLMLEWFTNQDLFTWLGLR